MSAMDPQTQERVYLSLKAEYRAGLLEPGRRLDLQDLADHHQASKTPLREAASRLLGEKLFERHPDGGFMVSSPPGDGIRQLHQLNGLMISGIVESVPPELIMRCARQTLASSRPTSPLGAASLTGELFVGISMTTRISEIVNAVINVNDRLLYPRIQEATNSLRFYDDLAALAQHMTVGSTRSIQKNIYIYHEKRQSID